MRRRPKPGLLRRLAVRVLLFVVAVCGALVVAEVAVRIAFPHTKDYVLPGGTVLFDEELGWRLTPGSHGTHRSQYFEVDYEINALGFRDRPRRRELSTEQPPYRVLVYGDSQVFGWGLPSRARFSELLEERLQGVEVWNLGVPAYGLDQQLLLHEKVGGQFGADAVVLFVSEVTIYRSYHRMISSKHKPRYRLGEEGGLVLESPPAEAVRERTLLHRLLSPFHLPYFVERQLRSWEERGRAAGERGATEGPEPGLAPLERAMLLRARELVSRGDQTLMLLSNLNRAPGQELKMFCERHGVELVELDVRRDDPQLVHGPLDTHWNSAAHQRVADVLEPALARGRASSARQGESQAEK